MRPGRIALAAALLLVAAACVRLSFWQQARLRERRSHNARLLRARRMPPLRAAALVRIPFADSLAQRPAMAEGTFDTPRTVILRNRWHGDRQGVEVVTPMLLPGGLAVLVDRGWLPSPDGLRSEWRQLPARPRELVGLLQAFAPNRDQGGEAVLPGGGGAPPETTWRALDVAALRARLPYPVASFWVRQLPDPADPGPPLRATPEAPDDGPHLSYAIQWAVFAAAAGAAAVQVLRAPRGSATLPK